MKHRKIFTTIFFVVALITSLILSAVFVFIAANNVFASSLNYYIDYRNSNIAIPEERKQAVINQVLTSWPKSKISENWSYVYDKAVSNGWNPAFVIALWIEESGASGLSAYDLGCLGGNRNDITSQLDCLFNRPYANESFPTFMCMYSEGEDRPDCDFLINPNFPRNLGFWYYQLTGDAGVGDNIGDDLDPNQPPGIPYSEETIFLRDSLASNNLPINYRQEVTMITPTPTPSLTSSAPFSLSRVQGTKTETGTKNFSGNLEITAEGKRLPFFSIMEKNLSFALEKLLPESLRKEFLIDDSQEITGKTRHFVYGLNENGSPNTSEKLDLEKVPEEKAKLPSWWNRLIGESKVVCGIFNTCSAPKSLNLKFAYNEYDPPEGLGHHDSSFQIKEENLDNEIISSHFTVLSFFKKFFDDIADLVNNIFGKKETTTTALLSETRAIVPGGENIRENTSFFKNFLPASAIPAHRNSPLKVSADYEVSPSYYTLAGEEKLEYHNLGATQRNYCLSLCSQYPAGFDIRQVDPLCPSCNPNDYLIDGYGDIPLNQDLCQRNSQGGCDYYDPAAAANCPTKDNPYQDPFCEGGRCNPYEIGIDSDYTHCGGPLWGSCVNENVCYLMHFASNPKGGFGECQYANPDVCVRADRLKVGQCAAVCNWACCVWQKEK